MSCQNSKRARHRQQQAAYEARFAIAIEAEQFLVVVIATPWGGAAGVVMLRAA
jgi:hypothetical protein